MRLRAISIRQPYAWAVVTGLKTIENRSLRFTRAYRGLVLIHAGKTIDLGPYPDHTDWIDASRLPRGGFVGAAVITGAVTRSRDPWFRGPLGLVLDHPIALPLKRWPGQVGLFGVSSSALGAWFEEHIEPLLEI